MSFHKHHNSLPAQNHAPQSPEEEEEEEEEEEDYMTMTFPDDPPPTLTTTTTTTTNNTKRTETSLQRHQRLKREAEARARPKSKAELAAEAEARREAALSQSLFTTQPKSKGLAMMARMGFTGGALGKKQPPPPPPPPPAPSGLESSSSPLPSSAPAPSKEGPRPADTSTSASGTDHWLPPRTTEPIRIEIKDGREGIGLESERKRKLREAAVAAGERAKRARADEGEYRERMRREREEARLERLVVAGQKVAAEKMMAGDRGTTETEMGRLLKGIPVVFRGLVRGREEADRDRRMRYDLEQGLARLPTYEDAEEDEDDRKALGRAGAAHVMAEDLDEEDAELDEFNALPPDERLRRVVQHLRDEYHYCFWCKFTYPDEEMEGCPGLTEEDH
ncbi:hypothetical protein N658DRAFT_498046, partial [Parathielavia hyrcaniae]